MVKAAAAARRISYRSTGAAVCARLSAHPLRASHFNNRVVVTSEPSALLNLRRFHKSARLCTTDTPQSFSDAHFGPGQPPNRDDSVSDDDAGPPPTEHAVISTFDLFSIGIGPSSSHTVGPMRAGCIFTSDLRDANLLDCLREPGSRIKLSLYGSLAATGEGHLTPSALLLGLEGADCETVDTEQVIPRFESIKQTKRLCLGRDLDGLEGGVEVDFDYEKDLKWMWGQTLPLHSNGMRMSVFDAAGNLVATNDFYSVGGGFVINGKLSTSASSAASPPLHASLEDGAGEDSSSAIIAKDDHPEHHPVDVFENIFYKSIRRDDAGGDRRAGSGGKAEQDFIASGLSLEAPDKKDRSLTALSGEAESQGSSSDPPSPPYPYHNAQSLLALTRKHNLTIAQLVYQNELTWYTPQEIDDKLTKIWSVMDECIRAGVHSQEKVLPGSLQLKRRAPSLYARLMRGFYAGHGTLSESPSRKIESERRLLDGSTPETELATQTTQAVRRGSATSGPPRVHGRFNHAIMPIPPRRTVFPAMDFLSAYAIAINEENAAGKRVVTSPTNGAAGVIPAVLKYVLEFISEDEKRDVQTFLLTAAAIGMLFKRGATISAAEGGCQAEVGVACSMAAGGFAACMGGGPDVIEQAAEIGIEHNLGLTCDPVGGLVQAPCIERNALGAVKAVVSAQLALASGDGKHAVSLDEAIAAMRVTARDMHMKYKETSLSGLATNVRIPVAVPDC